MGGAVSIGKVGGWREGDGVLRGEHEWAEWGSGLQMWRRSMAKIDRGGGAQERARGGFGAGERSRDAGWGRRCVLTTFF